MSARTTRMRRSVAAALLLTLVPAFAGCSTDDTDAAPSATHTAANGDVYNDADADFAAEMIPHHADALVMVDMTQGRELSPRFADLTESIRAAQAPEIEIMADWLTAWGEDVPETSRDHVNSHSGTAEGDSGMAMDGGMGMDPDDLAALDAMQGKAFETMWLTMMVEHHRGAIEMAQSEQASGIFRDALDLAGSIESGQTAEVDLMQSMIGG